MTERTPILHLSTLPEAKILADLDSIRYDLQRVVDITQELLSTDNPILFDACLTASLMIYRRCFISGVRAPLSRHELLRFGEGFLSAHDYFIAQANKMVAHSVNNFEQPRTGVLVENNKIIGAAVLIGRKDVLGRNGVRDWKRNVQALIDQVVSPKFNQARDALIAAARQIPIADIKKAPKLSYTVPGPADAHKRRH